MANGDAPPQVLTYLEPIIEFRIKYANILLVLNWINQLKIC